jgi:hypothetical protein
MSNDATANDPAVQRKVALATLEAGQYTAHGLAFKVRVSPCSWMYEGYGFQVEYNALDETSHGFKLDKALKVETATRADVQRLLDSLTPTTCSRCKTPYVLADDTKTYRGTLCEPCWAVDFKKRCEEEDKKERAAIARQDAKMLKKGYTHRISAWVHAGGDDKLVDWYVQGEPTQEQVSRLLKRARSRVLDDYKIIPLVQTKG